MHINTWKVIKILVGHIFETKLNIKLQNTLMHISNPRLANSYFHKVFWKRKIFCQAWQNIFQFHARPVSSYSTTLLVFYWVLTVWKWFLRKTRFKKFKFLRKNARTGPTLMWLIWTVNIIDKAIGKFTRMVN